MDIGTGKDLGDYEEIPYHLIDIMDAGEKYDIFRYRKDFIRAYIDVVGVSNWLYQYDSAIYYSVEDAEGYLYTVRLEDSQLEEMSAQADYWNRTTEDAPMPEPHRLVGYVQKTADNVRESLAQSWDITVGEYDQYFGANFLNATTSTGVENSVPWFIGALFSGLFALLCLVFQLRAASVSRKCLKVLEERCLVEKAAQQLENSEEHFVVGKNRGILTRDFIFGKGTGAVIAYTDVIWAYKMDRRSYMVENAYLMAGTPWMGVENVIDLNKPDKYGHVSDALAMISRKNPVRPTRLPSRPVSKELQSPHPDGCGLFSAYY